MALGDGRFPTQKFWLINLEFRSYRRLSGDILWLIGANLLSKPLWIIAENVVQNQLGHEVYGLVAAVMVFAQLGSVLMEWGLYAQAVRQTAMSSTGWYRGGYTLLRLRMILGWLYLGVISVLGWVWGYRGETWLWLALWGGYFWLLSLLQLLRSVVQGRQDFRADAFFSASEKLFALIGITLFWKVLSPQMYLQTLFTAALVSVLAVVGWVRRRYGPIARNPSSVASLLREAAPFALLIWFTGLNERMHGVLLERWVGSYENGLYAAAYRWVTAGMMYLWIVLPVFFARFAAIGKNDFEKKLAQEMRYAQLIVAVPMIALGGYFIAWPEVFLSFFTRSTAQEQLVMARTLQILAGCLILNGIFNVYSTYLTAVGYEKKVMYVLVGLFMGQGILSFWVIPTWGAWGAAGLLLVAYAVLSVAYAYLYKTWAPAPLDKKLLVRLGLWAVCVVLGGLGARFLFEGGMMLGMAMTAYMAFTGAIWGFWKQIWQYARRA
ncbi:MAG: lipopolysaccharide biosynthesis protein [Bacteroidia bacterium]